MSQAGVGGRYDFGFADASGNFVGLMLTKDKNGKPNYAETNDPGLAAQYFTGQPGYANYEPEKELQIGQNDWRSGFGQEYFDKNDDKRYYYGKNIDTRERGRIKCGIDLVTATLPSVLTITDSGLETWTDANTLTNWTYSETDADFVLAREATIIDSGTYSAKISAGAAIGGYGQILEAAVTWSNDFRNKTFSISVRIRNSDIAQIKGQLIIDDGIGTTTANSTGSGSFETVTCTRKLDAAATKLEVIGRALYMVGGGSGAVYFDTIQFPTIGAHGSHWAEFDDDLFCASGKYLLRMDASTGTISVQAGFPATITDIEAFTDDNLYIAQGASVFYYYMSTAEVVTVSNSYAYFFKTISTTMYKVLLPRSVYTATAPTTDAGWSSATTIGSTAENITSITELNGLPYIGKEDMPYYITAAGVVTRLMPDLISEKSSTSGTNAHVWQGKYYFPCGVSGLYEYDGGTVTDISPAKYITNSTDFDEEIMALASDAQWLYAIVDNGTKVEVLAGRWETIDSTTSFVWHNLAEITLAGCANAYVSSVYDKRLWIGSTDSSDSLYYLDFGSYETGGELITPYLHSEFRADSKAFFKITLTMADTTTNVYWTAYYEKLGDSSWTEINSTSKFKTSPTTTAYLPVDGSSNKPTSPMMRFKFVPITNSASSTPVLLGYDVRAVWFPSHKKFILAQVKVADNLELKDGTRDDTQGASEIRTAITAWDNPTTAWMRAFYPPYWLTATDTIYAKLQPTTGVPFLQMVFDETTGTLEWIYNLTLLVVAGVTF